MPVHRTPKSFDHKNHVSKHGIKGELKDRIKCLFTPAENEDLREFAVTRLRIIGDERAVEPLVHALKSEKSFFVKCEIIEALASFNNEAARKALAPALKDPDEEIRHTTARLLQETLLELREITPLQLRHIRHFFFNSENRTAVILSAVALDKIPKEALFKFLKGDRDASNAFNDLKKEIEHKNFEEIVEYMEL